jgi:hypothetical protein
VASNSYSNPQSGQWLVVAEAMALEAMPDQVIAALQQVCR